MRRPVGSRRLAISCAWPPAPTVASTNTCPGAGANRFSTSAGITGTWRGAAVMGGLLREREEMKGRALLCPLALFAKNRGPPCLGKEARVRIRSREPTLLDSWVEYSQVSLPPVRQLLLPGGHARLLVGVRPLRISDYGFRIEN